MSILNVSVKWNKQRFDNVPLNTAEPPLAFKKHLQTLTKVPPERQKVMGGKGGILKDDADWAAVGVKEGQIFMLMGTPDEPEPEPIVTSQDEDSAKEKEKEEEDGDVNVAGLSNLGNTCYLNATLQTLRSIPALTNAVKEVSGETQYRPETTLALGLQHLFNEMDSASTVEPLIFVNTFRTVFPQFATKSPNGTYMQQDAEECWTQLLMLLNQKLPNNVVGNLFTGQQQIELKCLDSASTEPAQNRQESFQKLSCHINENISHLVYGLKKSLEEKITKRSEELGRDAEYQKTAKISQLPLYLPIQFVRFFWKQQQGTDGKNKPTALKILKPVSYPPTLDVYDLCSDSLKAKLDPRREAIRAAEDAKLRSNKKAKTEDNADVEMKPAEESAPAPITENDSGLYDLMAVITHKGRAADGGHYVAWVRGKHPELWFKYDDDTITTVRSEDVLALDGKKGGDWHLAYMCLYASKGLLPTAPPATKSSKK